MTRALEALLRGDVGLALSLNAASVPLLGVLVLPLPIALSSVLGLSKPVRVDSLLRIGDRWVIAALLLCWIRAVLIHATV